MKTLPRPAVLGSPGSGFYEPEAQLPGSTPPGPDRLGFWSTYTHEDQHWIQHHGTSVGLLLATLKGVRDISILRRLKAIPPDILASLFRERRTNNQPVVQFDDDFSPMATTKDHPEAIRLLNTVLADTELTRDLFYESRLPIRSWYRPIEQSVAFALRDCVYECGEALGDEPEQIRPPSFDRFQGLPKVPTPDGHILSTHLLLEADAVAQELMFSQATGAPVTTIENRVENLVGSSYLSPLHMFSQVTGLGIRTAARDGISTMLATFSLLIDIALNPPLPPLNAAQEHWSDMQLEDLLPAARFLRALDASRLKRLIVRDLEDNASLIATTLELCETAQLPCVSLGEQQPLAREPWSGFRKYYVTPVVTAENSDDNELKQRDHFDFACWSYAAAAAMRKQNYTRVAFNGYHRGRQALLEDGHGPVVLTMRRGHEWLTPPCRTVGKQLVGSFFVADELSEHLMHSVLNDYFFFDLAFTTGKPSFPTNLPMDESFHQGLTDNIEQLLGVRPW